MLGIAVKVFMHFANYNLGIDLKEGRGKMESDGGRKGRREAQKGGGRLDLSLQPFPRKVVHQI